MRLTTTRVNNGTLIKMEGLVPSANTVARISTIDGKTIREFRVSAGTTSLFWDQTGTSGKAAGRGKYIVSIMNAGQTLNALIDRN
jgi:flagellar hook assembly protein FlgD